MRSLRFTRLANATVGPVTLNELVVSYKADGNSYDLGVAVSVSFAGFVSLAGEFDVVKGKLHTISIDASFTPGELPIPETGLSITDIHLKLTNLDTPAKIVATGYHTGAQTYALTRTHHDWSALRNVKQISLD